MYLKIIFLFETHQLFAFTDILEILIWHLKNKVPVSIPGSYYFLNKYQNPNTGVYCGTMTTNTLVLHVAPSFQKLLPFFSGQLAIHSDIKRSSSTTHSGGPPPSTLMGASWAPWQQCGSSSGRPPLKPPHSITALTALSQSGLHVIPDTHGRACPTGAQWRPRIYSSNNRKHPPLQWAKPDFQKTCSWGPL